MANWEQTMSFYPKDMGKQKGWCLQNCRLGFHIYKPKYASAKAAMDAAKKNGTWHAGTPPDNIAVPVYTKTASKYGHVMVFDRGIWYSDGSKVSKPTVLGWDEMMDGTRVVKIGSGSGFLPAKGYWGRYDKDERVARLATFMRNVFPAYTPKAALGPYYGDKLYAAIREFQRRSNGKLYPDGFTGPKTYEELKKYGFKG